MNIDNNTKRHFFIVLHIFMLALVEAFMIKSRCLANNKCLESVCLIVFLFYGIKEFFRIKWDLIRREPICTFIIEVFADISLLINMFVFITICNYEDATVLYSYSIYLYLILFFIRLLQYLLYSEDGKQFLIFIGAFLLLSIFNKDNQELITIFTTLVTTIFGRTVLKKLFVNQIHYYEENKIAERSDILDKLEYGLASFNIKIIFAHIIILVTEYYRSGCVYKNILNELDLSDNILIGSIRIIILAIVYIISILGIGNKIKEKLFNILMKIK